MKNYKQFLLVILCIVLLLSLSGCMVIPLSKYYVISEEEVASVQFYDLRGEESEHYAGFDKKCEPVYTLPAEEHQAFLDDFSEMKFSDTILIVLAAVDPSFSYGDWVIRINFSNGQYTFYSSNGYGETYDGEGEFLSSTHFSCDEEELETLIRKFYTTE